MLRFFLSAAGQLPLTQSSPKSSAGVVICTLSKNTIQKSPVHITAAAAATPGHFITSMRVYIDNVAKYTSNDNQLTTDLPLPHDNVILVVVRV